MQLAKVIGDVVMTRKDENLAGITLLIVQPLTPDRQPAGRPLVAVDSVGAGIGEEVFFVRGKEASFPFYPAEPPVDLADRVEQRRVDGRKERAGGRLRHRAVDVVKNTVAEDAVALHVIGDGQVE